MLERVPFRAIAVLGIVACGGPPPAATPPAAPAPAAPAPAPPPVTRAALRAAQVNGTVLHYRRAGDSGAPVVFVHGTLGDLRSWEAQDTAFARGYRVLVYSRRYHPPNPQVDDGQVYSPKLHAEDLAALLLRLELAPAHVVGSSYGAYTALVLARDHPALVRSLVLGEPPVVPLLTGTPAGDSVRRAFFISALNPARAAFARGDSVAALRAFLRGVSGVHNLFDRLPEPIRRNLLAHAFEMRREMLANREQYLPSFTCAELGRVTIPVLVVRGERSVPFFQFISDELVRCLRTETTVVVPGAGHAMHEANPAYYNRVVSRFLAAH